MNLWNCTLSEKNHPSYFSKQEADSLKFCTFNDIRRIIQRIFRDNLFLILTKKSWKAYKKVSRAKFCFTNGIMTAPIFRLHYLKKKYLAGFEEFNDSILAYYI